MIAKGRKKHADPLRKPAPAVVPTELPVFEELERRGLVVVVSGKKPAQSRERAQRVPRTK